MEKLDKDILATIPKTGLTTNQISKESGLAYTTVNVRLLRLMADGVVELDEVRSRGGAKKNVWKIKGKVR